jgi:predicted amino acid racemase
MTAKATVTVDLAKIAENARTVVSALPGVAIIGVTKVTCGSPQIARAMLAGGVSGIGESRLENVERMRAAGIDCPYWLLRAPTPDLAEDTARLADVSLQSEVETVAALELACERAGARHRIVAMVDLGDLREGMMPSDLPGFLDDVRGFEHVEVTGIGASLTCYGAIVPDERNLSQLVELAEAAEAQLGRRLVVSGGMSTTLDAFSAGIMPGRIDNLRVGEAIVLGVSPATRENILGLHTDAITVSAPVIECKVKPSKPIGVSAQDAFGDQPQFEDLGERRRAICAIGRQDVVPGGLVPVDPRVKVLGASSDHLILDVHDLDRPPALGDPIRFVPGYSATLALFTSPYVEKEWLGEHQ